MDTQIKVVVAALKTERDNPDILIELLKTQPYIVKEATLAGPHEYYIFTEGDDLKSEDLVSIFKDFGFKAYYRELPVTYMKDHTKLFKDKTNEILESKPPEG